MYSYINIYYTFCEMVQIPDAKNEEITETSMPAGQMTQALNKVTRYLHRLKDRTTENTDHTGKKAIWFRNDRYCYLWGFINNFRVCSECCVMNNYSSVGVFRMFHSHLSSLQILLFFLFVYFVCFVVIILPEKPYWGGCLMLFIIIVIESIKIEHFFLAPYKLASPFLVVATVVLRRVLLLGEYILYKRMVRWALLLSNIRSLFKPPNSTLRRNHGWWCEFIGTDGRS